MNTYKKFIKRILCVIISLCGLLMMFPLMIFIGILIRLDSKGNVIFKQRRLGKHQKEFIIYKFRTMVENASRTNESATYDGDPRITKVGAFLRKMSLDETPQLINMLKGEMCMIGPRPILKEEFENYSLNELYAKRYDVSPGLFCTVDIDYRATASRELQFEMDAKYVEDISFKLDIVVFIRTFISVLKRKNVYKYSRQLNNEESSIMK